MGPYVLNPGPPPAGLTRFEERFGDDARCKSLIEPGGPIGDSRDPSSDQEGRRVVVMCLSSRETADRRVVSPSKTNRTSRINSYCWEGLPVDPPFPGLDERTHNDSAAFLIARRVAEIPHGAASVRSAICARASSPNRSSNLVRPAGRNSQDSVTPGPTFDRGERVAPTDP